MRKYAFLLLSVISACCSSSHGDVFSIPLRNGKYTNTPDFFVEGAGHLVRNYKKITGNYPAAWEQIKDVHDLRFDPVYNVIFSRKGSSVEIKDNVLLDYDSISRKECYRYIIFKNDEFDFLLKSENNAGVQDYITDGLETWFCYADPQTEQDVIKKCDGMVRSHSLFNSDERRTDAILQLSHIPWIPFTHISHTISLNKNDSVPRLSWGKYYERDGRILLPYSVQVHHAFADGIHIARFRDALERRLLGDRTDKGGSL